MNFISLSKKPSKLGQYFYNNLFKHHEIDATYTSLQCDNLEKALKDAFEKEVDGISISMPFKKEVINFLDSYSKDVEEYESCNTIIRKNGKYHGENTDVQGVLNSISTIVPLSDVSVLGNGSMGKIYDKILKGYGYNTKVYSRSLNNWDSRHERTDVVVNCTSLGTLENKSPLKYLPKDVKLIIDLSINENKLTLLSQDIDYYSGKKFYRSHFKKQFELYTGTRPEMIVYDKLEKELNE